MKKLLTAFLFMAIASTGFCTKPCNGLCGFKLAEKMDKNKISEITQTTKSGRKTYIAKDYNKFMDFNIVRLDTLPDDSIFTISLICYKNASDANLYFYNVIKTIETFYEVDNLDKMIVDLPIEKKAYYKFSNDSKMIVSCNKGKYNAVTEVSIFLTKDELIDKANKIDVESTVDTSALE